MLRAYNLSNGMATCRLLDLKRCFIGKTIEFVWVWLEQNKISNLSPYSKISLFNTKVKSRECVAVQYTV